jgi:hypothetical protein
MEFDDMHNENKAPCLEDLKDLAAWQRLEEQLQWYHMKSTKTKRWYKILRVTQLSLAAFIPVVVLAGTDWSRWVTAIFGGLIAVFEGIQQLNQFGPQWLEYRATAERLKHEKYLFLSRGAHYRDLDPGESICLLAERVEENVSQENARWVSISKLSFEKKPTR